jgi:hypothetical protein
VVVLRFPEAPFQNRFNIPGFGTFLGVEARESPKFRTFSASLWLGLGWARRSTKVFQYEAPWHKTSGLC